jgi:hypothetical protein
MYRCPDDFDDGMGIDFRSVDLEIAGCIKQIGQLRFDVILLDAHHAYETSLRDLTFARDLLTDHGTIVVHDCDPPSEKVARPDFIVTSWAGVTYKAYLDFVMKCNDLAYFTIDTDWGCGIIRKKSALTKVPASRGNSIALQWQRIGKSSNQLSVFCKRTKFLC